MRGFLCPGYHPRYSYFCRSSSCFSVAFPTVMWQSLPSKVGTMSGYCLKCGEWRTGNHPCDAEFANADGTIRVSAYPLNPIEVWPANPQSFDVVHLARLRGERSFMPLCAPEVTFHGDLAQDIPRDAPRCQTCQHVAQREHRKEQHV